MASVASHAATPTPHIKSHLKGVMHRKFALLPHQRNHFAYPIFRSQAITFFQIFIGVTAGYAVAVPNEYDDLTAWMQIFNLDLDQLNVYPAG